MIYQKAKDGYKQLKDKTLLVCVCIKGGVSAICVAHSYRLLFIDGERQIHF